MVVGSVDLLSDFVDWLGYSYLPVYLSIVYRYTTRGMVSKQRKYVYFFLFASLTFLRTILLSA